MSDQRPRNRLPQLLILALLSLPTLAAAQEEEPRPAPPPKGCNRLIQAGVVALDQVFFWNRYGAVEPQGMIYALEHDVVSTGPGTTLEPGRVALRPGKRPRPLVLRMNEGDCIAIHFRNLLNPTPEDEQQPHTRAASIHVVGMQLLQTIRDDGSDVGANGGGGDGVVAPGQSITYMLYAEREG
ncbi:MAG TPA: copper oxidase, partial [Thermoanaerobaculia bacterium]|nr:copper oxidase [Thermoanaerobaculia bacterium]